jgi:Carboxypeptidase regulatory-like domain
MRLIRSWGMGNLCNSKFTFVTLALVTLVGVRIYPAPLPGQSFELRTVSGMVVSAEGVPMRSAIVYLYDDRTQSVRTWITDKSGHYRFSGLFPSDDYEIHAEGAGSASGEHRISKLDDHRDFLINLRISRPR